MKYMGLIGAIIKGLVLIGLVAWLLLQFRENFVYGRALVPWGLFAVIAGGVLGLVFAFGAKICAREIKKLGGESEKNGR